MAKCRYCGRRAIIFSDICSECWDRQQEATGQATLAAAAAVRSTAVPVAAGPTPKAAPAFTYRNLEAFAFGNPGPLSLVMVAACTALAIITLPYDPESSWARLVAWGAQINEEVDAGDWWRLLSAAFLHGGWGHLLGNMYALSSWWAAW